MRGCDLLPAETLECVSTKNYSPTFHHFSEQPRTAGVPLCANQQKGVGFGSLCLWNVIPVQLRTTSPAKVWWS